MSLILNIDTALDTASVCLSEDHTSLQLAFSENKNDHALWLHKKISELLHECSHTVHDLKAIAVSIGPGSYTGLRVGLSAAKGFCYALNIPLITVNTLKIIAFAVKDEAVDLICPVIDARRMEVFTSLFDKDLEEKKPPHSMIIDENSFAQLFLSNKILFCGNGVKKLQAVIVNKMAGFSNTEANASHLAQLSPYLFHKEEFANLAYSEPLYIKEFYSPHIKAS